MKRSSLLRSGCLLVFLSATRFLSAIDLVVHDVDIRSAAVGDTVLVAVDAHGLDPSSFCAFALELQIPTDAFALQAVERGDLIDAQGADKASRDASPYLWALEARQDGASLRLAGMILMEGVNSGEGNLSALSRARIPAADGELIRLRLKLLSTTPAPITVVASPANLLVGDLLTAGSTAAGSAPAGSMAGGTTTGGGLPNDWEYRYFGLAGTTSDADADGDRRSNLTEFADGTSPVQPDVLVKLLAGWNLISLPVQPADPTATAVLSSANRRGTAKQDPVTPVYADAVWGWSGPPRGHFVKVSRLEPFHAYWVFAPVGAELVVPGALPATTAVVVEAGWNLLGPLATVNRADCAATVAGVFWSWDAAAQQYAPDRRMLPGCGYWAYCRAPGTLEVDPQ